MKKILLFGLLNLLFSICYSQKKADSIKIRYYPGDTYLYTLHGEVLSTQELKTALKVDPEARYQVAVFDEYRTYTYIFSIAGGFLIGYQLGTLLAGKNQPNWIIAGAGGGMIILAIPFSINAKKHLKKAISLYNSNLTETNVNRKRINLGLNPSGISINFHF